MAPKQLADLLPSPVLTLSQLRDARRRRQVDVARAMDLRPSSVAHLEEEPNPKIASLRKYLEAIGLELVLVAVAKHHDGTLDRHVFRLPGSDQRDLTTEAVTTGTWREFSAPGKQQNRPRSARIGG